MSADSYFTHIGLPSILFLRENLMSDRVTEIPSWAFINAQKYNISIIPAQYIFDVSLKGHLGMYNTPANREFRLRIY